MVLVCTGFDLPGVGLVNVGLFPAQRTSSLESSSDQSKHLRLSALAAFLTKILPAVLDIGSSAHFVNKLLFLGWTD